MFPRIGYFLLPEGQQEFHNWVFDLLSKQTGLKKLPDHGYQILLSWFLFGSTSYICYYFIAPKLIPFASKKSKTTQNKMINNTGPVSVEESIRIKWGHMLTSTFHCLITIWWSTYLWYSKTLATTLESRVHGYLPIYGNLMAFTIGYFLFDFSLCVYHVRMYGYGFIIHAILGIVSMSLSLRPCMMYPASRFLIFELSTLFVNSHWIIEKLGFGGTKLILVNDIIGFLIYVVVRLFFGPYLTYRFASDLYAERHKIKITFSILASLGHITTHTLNFYWFFKLLKSVRKSMNSTRQSKKAKTN